MQTKTLVYHVNQNFYKLKPKTDTEDQKMKLKSVVTKSHKKRIIQPDNSDKQHSMDIETVESE